MMPMVPTMKDGPEFHCTVAAPERNVSDCSHPKSEFPMSAKAWLGRMPEKTSKVCKVNVLLISYAFDCPSNLLAVLQMDVAA